MESGITSSVVSFNAGCFLEETKALVWPARGSFFLLLCKRQQDFFPFKILSWASLVTPRGKDCFLHCAHESAVCYRSWGLSAGHTAQSWSWCELWLIDQTLLCGWGTIQCLRCLSPPASELLQAKHADRPSWFYFDLVNSYSWVYLCVHEGYMWAHMCITHVEAREQFCGVNDFEGVSPFTFM